ncbi:MAG: TetR/AcrR family transcriptional regulator [Chloroflexota bacterium]
MSSKKADPRVLRTRQLLRDALLDLIREKGFEAITIQDLTDRAQLNRVTFYLHYRDKQDLLTRSMEDMLDELVARAELTPLPNSSNEADRGLEHLTGLFEHVAQHKDFYRVMLGKDGMASFAAQLRSYIEQFVYQRIESKQPEINYLKVPTNIYSRFMAAAYVGVIAWWLENDQPHSPAKMAEWLWRLTLSGTPDDFRPDQS